MAGLPGGGMPPMGGAYPPGQQGLEGPNPLSQAMVAAQAVQNLGAQIDREKKRMENEVTEALSRQRDLRRPLVRRGERDVELEKKRQEAAKGRWTKARDMLTAQKTTTTLQNVSSESWIDIHSMFFYFNEVYFENKLNNVVISWIDREDEDADFRYCIGTDVPKWWHGPRKILCAGICCQIERQITGAYARTCHIRLPNALRKFKLVKETKATLLHEMIHAYLYLTGQIMEGESFNDHSRLFKQHMHRINTDTLVFDAYRPKEGYGVSFADVAHVEEEEAKRRELIDDFSDEHWKVLYLISKFSKLAELATDKERWVRQLSILVLIYEGIVAGKLDYDYAPASIFLEGKRVYINLTQEGKDNIDDLLEVGLIRYLRMVTKDNQSVVSYQVTVEGLEMLPQKLTRDLRAEVDEFIYAPDTEELLLVEYDGEVFTLKSERGTLGRVSSILETEDVSYVTSPYLPYTLRDAAVPLHSNAYRALEAAQGESNLKDELDVTVSLSKIVVMVGEWIPFGCNHLLELSAKLGVKDRTAGGYLTPEVDMKSSETALTMPSGLTRVHIDSYHESQFINLDAEVEFPEDDGIIQVEHFGLRYQRDGVTLYALKIEAVMDQVLKDVSLDNMSRVMADVHADSSTVTDSLLSGHQKKLLDMIYSGHADARNKVKVVFIAGSIEPKLRAIKYLDGDACECEIRQVIGDTLHAFDISDTDIVIFGAEGVLFAGPQSMRFETLLLAFMSLKAREIFILNYFNRMFVIDEGMKKYRKEIDRFNDDPNNIPRIRAGLNAIYEDATLLEEVLYYFQQSLEEDALPEDKRPDITDPEALRLLHVLQIDSMETSLRHRAEDCTKSVQAAKNEIVFLQSQIKNCADLMLRQVQQTTMNMFQSSKEQMMINDTASNSLDIMQMIFAGSLAFAILDRMTGDWSVLDTEWGQAYFLFPIVLKGELWWLAMSFITWLIGGIFILSLLKAKKDAELGMVGITVVIERAVHMRQFSRWIQTKAVAEEHVAASDIEVVTEYKYDEETSGGRVGYAPQIVLNVNTKYGIINTATIFCQKHVAEKARAFPTQLKNVLIDELDAAGVLVALDTGVVNMMGHSSGRKVVMVTSQDDVVEIVLEKNKLEELKEKVATKLGYQPTQVLKFKQLNTIEGRVFEEEVESDEMVALMRPYTRVVGYYSGLPDPNRAIFAKHFAALKNEAVGGTRVALLGGRKKKGNAGLGEDV